MGWKIFLSFILVIMSSTFVKAEDKIIGCVNGTPIYLNDYNRLMKAQVSKFEKRRLFDPWETSTYAALEERNNLIREAKQKNTLIQPSDVSFYKGLFQQKAKELGSPVNTYDLNSYAEENALLLQAFVQEQSQKIQDTLIQKQLLAQEARQRGLKVENWEIETRLQEVRSKYSNEKDYREFLRKNNSTELELKMEIEEQILVDKMRASFLKAEGEQAEGSSLSIGALSSLSESNGDFERWLKKSLQTSQIKFALPVSGQTIGSCNPEGSVVAQAPQPKAVQYVPPKETEKRTLFSKVSFGKNKSTDSKKKNLASLKKWFGMPEQAD